MPGLSFLWSHAEPHAQACIRPDRLLCTWVVVKIVVPFWVPIVLRHLIFSLEFSAGKPGSKAQFPTRKSCLSCIRQRLQPEALRPSAVMPKPESPEPSPRFPKAQALHPEISQTFQESLAQLFGRLLPY